MDIDPAQSPHKALRFVLAPSHTPASAVYASKEGVEGGEWQEVCPQGLLYVEELATRVVEGGGAALIADYGDNHTTNTLRVRPYI